MVKGERGIYIYRVRVSMVMSRDRNAGRGEGVKIDNGSIERVEVFKYLGATLTN
jgi:hypothetical protein